MLFSSLNTSENLARKDNQMARKPNYGFEKRQKELAKKAKKEEKKKAKMDEGEESPQDSTQEPSAEN
jgi:hypothetical protein